MIDVYLVPVSATQHELYSEVPDLPDDEPDPEPSRSWFARLKAKFREALAEAERERRAAHVPARPAGWVGRIKAQTMRWVAETIAEQRLLWHLRNETEGRLHYPDDVTVASAAAELRASLTRDFEKHRFWMVIDALAFVASGLFALIPGPNLLAYFFAFRLVGRYFSLRGARRGLQSVLWHYEAAPPLTDLRGAIALDPEVRVSRAREVASRLRLEHLASFFERAAFAPHGRFGETGS